MFSGGTQSRAGLERVGSRMRPAGRQLDNPGLGCKDCCANINSLTYLLTYLQYFGIFFEVKGRVSEKRLVYLVIIHFCVSSVNYSLVLSSLSIHTTSSANAEGLRAPCQLKSCKMLHKCSTDCIQKSMQPVNDLQGNSRSMPLLPFDWPYRISYQSSIVCKCISLSWTVFEISTLICLQIKTLRDLDHSHCLSSHDTTNTSRVNPCTKFDDSIFSHSREI